MLRYLCVRLPEIEVVDVRVLSHCKILSYRVLLATCHAIKDKDEIRKRLAWWNDVVVIEECKIADFLDWC